TDRAANGERGPVEVQPASVVGGDYPERHGDRVLRFDPHRPGQSGTDALRADDGDQRESALRVVASDQPKPDAPVALDFPRLVLILLGTAGLFAFAFSFGRWIGSLLSAPF